LSAIIAFSSATSWRKGAAAATSRSYSVSRSPDTTSLGGELRPRIASSATTRSDWSTMSTLVPACSRM